MVRSKHLDPVFIVGQYKCGTSWLLQILSAHPQAVGVSELDVIRAAYRVNGRRVESASPEERLQRFFDGWCPWRGGRDVRCQGSDVRSALERGDDVPQSRWDPTRPRACTHIPSDALRAFYWRVKEARTPEDAMDAFLIAAMGGVDDSWRLVLKAADQIAIFDLLMAWRPRAPKIVITRDGRDASISALHFRRLMGDLNAPFRGERESDYWELLRAWATRADMVKARADAGELRLIRYEDLTADFAGTLAPLLTWLGLDARPELINTIDARSSFMAMTGRPRGSEAQEPRRRGAVGEWLEVLGDQDREKAWTIAGRQLTAFGYTEDGKELLLLRGRMGLDHPGVDPSPAHSATPGPAKG